MTSMVLFEKHDIYIYILTGIFYVVATLAQFMLLINVVPIYILLVTIHKIKQEKKE